MLLKRNTERVETHYETMFGLLFIKFWITQSFTYDYLEGIICAVH